MNKYIPHLLIIFFTALSSPRQAKNSQEYSIRVGVVIDNTSRAGREAKASMEMALDDFSRNTHQNFALHVINSQGESLSAAIAARNLIHIEKVQVILGPHTWEEASSVVEVGNRDHIPTVSLVDSTPKWATEKWPFLVQASISNQHAQMKAVAAIMQSWEWHRVTIIYEEDIDSATSRVIPNLLEALREAGAEIIHLVPLAPFLSSSLSEELGRLKRDQCRVFVVHTSLKLAIHLFQNANEMQMMEKGYIWIATNTIADFLHSLDVSTISSMQGVLGVKTYFPKNTQKFLDFKKKFRKKFRTEYPDEEENSEPGISAVEAYDAMWAVALTLNEGNKHAVSYGQHFVDKVSLIDFIGMTGRVHFVNRQLAIPNLVEIVNVIRKRPMELGDWSEGLGFSKTTNDKAKNSSFMQDLGQVIWPGEPSSSPRGWTLPTIANSLRIGVPAESIFKEYVNISYDPLINKFSCTGFAIEIFKETMGRLPYYVPFEFFPFHGTYDSLVEQVYLKKFDAVVGDVAVIARRYKHAEFTRTYSDSATVMIVPVKSEMPHKAWLFMKPFTKVMWALIVVVTIYNGFVIWLIERNHSPRLTGSAMDQTGILIYWSFTSLFSLNGGKLHSNLSRMTMVVWLFVALVITQSYTASLTSMLTVHKLEPKVADIETLKNNNAKVGQGKGGFMARYLEDVLGFKPSNIKNFSSPQAYAQALESGDIAAIFVNGDFAKLFLAKYCKSFIAAGPKLKVGGYGFAFPKGSPMVADVDEALSEVFESRKLQQLEDNMIGAEKCVEVGSSNDEEASLSLSSFWILFALTGGTSTCALAIYSLAGLRMVYNSILENSNFLAIIVKHWVHQRSRFSSKVSDTESSRNLPSV